MSIRLLVVSDGIVPTGLARVTQSLMHNLRHLGYDIHHLAVNYHGDPHGVPWPVYPAALGGDRYGFGRLADLVASIRPEAILLVNDLWIMAEYLKVLIDDVKVDIAIAVWAIVESTGLDAEWLQLYGKVRRIVACSSFAKEELLLHLPAAEVEIIPFGVDTAAFHALNSGSTREAKERLGLFAADEIDTSFVVLNANRNQPRKRIDLTMRAFSQFASGKPQNVKLYLHMGVVDVGWDILKLAKRFGIDDRLIVSRTGESTSAPAVTDEDLNLIYNACDVGINTAVCEGWGLVSLEHAAAGRPQILPDIPSLRDRWEGHGLLIPTSRTLVMERLHWDCCLMDEVRLVEALNSLYEDKAALTHWGTAARNHAQRPDYQWEAIAMCWNRLFRDVLNR